MQQQVVRADPVTGELIHEYVDRGKANIRNKRILNGVATPTNGSANMKLIKGSGAVPRGRPQS